METKINEIADGIYRLSTLTDAVPGGFTFNQFLVRGEQPLLFHTGLRGLFPSVSQAIATVIERTARRGVAEDLLRGERLFEGRQAERLALLRAECRVVAEEPRLKAVVYTEDVTAETDNLVTLFFSLIRNRVEQSFVDQRVNRRLRRAKVGEVAVEAWTLISDEGIRLERRVRGNQNKCFGAARD